MKKLLLLFFLFAAVSPAYPGVDGEASLRRYLDLACSFKDSSRYDQALRVLSAARRRFPDDRRIILLSAKIHYLNARPQQAVAAVKKLLENKPRDLDALLIAGLALSDMGDDDKAQGYLRTVVEEDTQNVVARLNLAQIYYRGHRLGESTEELKAVSLIDASIQNIHLLWAQMLDELGDIKGAFRLIEKLSLSQPGNLVAARMLEVIRKKLGEEYFAAERRKKVVARKEQLVFVKTFPRIEKMVFIRIGLHVRQPHVQLLCSGVFDLKDRSGKTVFESLAAGHAFMIIRGQDGTSVLVDEGGLAFALPDEVTVAPRDPRATVTLFDVTAGKENFWATTGEAAYRGTVEVRLRSEGYQTVNVLSLEEYLYSVVPSEMPAYWPLEALKAQAVAARSEAMAKLGRHRNEGFDFCDDVHCQAYKGVERETQATTRAVDETRGQILTYHGKPVDAVYSSSCGGHTQSNIFGDAKDIAYLQGVADMPDGSVRFPLSSWGLECWLKEPPGGIYCAVNQGAAASGFRWVRIYSAEEMNALVQALGDIGSVEKLIVLKRSDSGHIVRLKIVGEKKAYVIEKELAIRRALGNLRSSLFKVEVKSSADKRPGQFIFYGGGWGHGVGMCQTGSRGMAQAGKDFRLILRHYFHNTELTQLY